MNEESVPHLRDGITQFDQEQNWDHRRPNANQGLSADAPRGLASFALALVLFLILEGILFRSDFYPSYLSLSSNAGQITRLVDMARKTPYSYPQILVVGDSRMAEGFSAQIANERSKENGIAFVDVGCPGSTLRVSYYLIREIDPLSTRFQAVVIPFTQYHDNGFAENLNDRLMDIRFLLPLLDYSDIPVLADSYESWENRRQVILSGLFKGYGYKQDLYDFLRDPSYRLEQVRIADKNWIHSRQFYPGHEESLEGMYLEPDSRKVHFPDGVLPNVRYWLESQAKENAKPRSVALARYRRVWMGKIIEHYRNSPALMIAIRLPVSPLGPDHFTYKHQGVLYEFSDSGRLILMPENTFAHLEKPSFFFDQHHLNRAGRLRFSELLSKEVAAILEEHLKTGN